MGVKKWRASGPSSDLTIERIMRSSGVPRPIALYFAAHGVAEGVVNDFLNPRLAGLSDPYRFPGIQLAAKRMWDAVCNRELILIHGDYDTDGITGTALLSWVLRRNGANVVSFIPHRFDDGYGFTPESLVKALAITPECKLLITVDCGITSCDAVAEAVNRQIDTIITDHHEPGAELPRAMALINPKIYPELEDLHVLSGAGSAFKLAHAFIKYGREHNLGGFSTRLEEVLDYVALGTVADIVPLLGENRTMVRHGIEILKKQIRPGVRALIESCKLRGELTPSDITFKLAPRINAAGRVGDANIALRLLESENIVEAYQYAAELEEFNRNRQEKEQEIYQEARAQLEAGSDPAAQYALLVAGSSWHQGVIGIVASRLARDYNRPTIVLTIQDGLAYGSGRSIGKLNLVDVLSKTSNLLERYGGHPMAVGIGLKAVKIQEFQKAFEACVRESISLDELEEYIAYDGEARIGEFDAEFFRYLGKLAPFGHSSPKPVFRLNEVEFIKTYPVGQRHLRGIIRDRQHATMEFIAFSMPQAAFEGRLFDVLVSPQINHYAGNERPQLNIIDIRPVF